MALFDPKSIADDIVGGAEPMADEIPEANPGETSDEELAAEDVMAAFQANDPKALAAGLRAIFELMDAKPHAEGGVEADESAEE